MPPPIICFDLDGTLANFDGRIHPRDVEILSGGHDGVFIPATGRPLASVRRLLAANGLFTDEPIPLPLVTLNGGAIYAPGEELVACQDFDPAVQAALLEHLPRFREITFLLYTLNDVFATELNDHASEHITRWRMPIRPYDPATAPPDFMKLLCMTASNAALEQFAAELADLPLATHLAMNGVLEVYNEGFDKGWGVLTLLDELGLDPGCLVAAGDGENDLPLFEVACLSFCPSGSPDAICAQADQVIDTRENGLLTPIMAVVERETGMRG